ncbi:MAG: 30S ribosomal protein S16 [Bacteroidales bacterium]|jgi:small subunit ribosomal protein S16|nr:30S ribosomal protein S16 [Bacteroidales bacterium]
MAVKIRLSRHGKKNYAYFHIVVADARAPRDGRLIEQIGLYNPNTNPATIVLDGERALDWLNKGAQPTTTARRILSYEGVLLKKHLQGGVAKGAFSEEEAERRFAAWKTQKDSKLASKKQTIASANEAAAKAAIKAEAKVNEERAEAIAKKKAELAAAAEAAAKAAAEEAAAAAAEAEAPAENPEA